MEGIYSWIKNIIYYLIFVTMLMNLLPSGKYEKYLKLFSGCVLILLVLKPLTGTLRLEEQITALFNSFSFGNDVGEFRAQLDDMEGKRVSVLVERYEETAAGDIRRLAAMEGLTAREVSVEISGDRDSPDFGKIERVTVVLDESGMEDSETEAPGPDSREAAVDPVREPAVDPDRKVEPVDPVKVQVEMEAGGQSSPVSRPGVSAAGRTPAQAKKLRQAIAGCYQVEERYVEIRLKDE